MCVTWNNFIETFLYLLFPYLLVHAYKRGRINRDYFLNFQDEMVLCHPAEVANYFLTSLGIHEFKQM